MHKAPGRPLPRGGPVPIYGATLLAIAFALTSCGETKRVAEFIPTPPERLVCEQAGTRPTIPPETTIDWAHVTSVAQAKIEHEGYVKSVRTREGVVAGYVLAIEGKLFTCFNNAQRRREFEADLAKKQR